jgi:hypothetical protein
MLSFEAGMAVVAEHVAASPDDRARPDGKSRKELKIA